MTAKSTSTRLFSRWFNRIQVLTSSRICRKSFCRITLTTMVKLSLFCIASGTGKTKLANTSRRRAWSIWRASNSTSWNASEQSSWTIVSRRSTMQSKTSPCPKRSKRRARWTSRQKIVKIVETRGTCSQKCSKRSTDWLLPTTPQPRSVCSMASRAQRTKSRSRGSLGCRLSKISANSKLLMESRSCRSRYRLWRRL